MANVLPLFVTSRTAAKLFELPEAEFLRLVRGGHLPPPSDIAGHMRCDVASLRCILNGEAADGREPIKW